VISAGRLNLAQGIHIGDSFFPMRPHQETSPHELYIRAVPANKTTAPLKFYAKVVGKFMVERQLGSRVESLVRDKTAAAEKQRTERKTILLDAPPPTAPPVKPPKKTATKKKHISVETSRSLSASSSTQPSRMVSPRPPLLQTKEQMVPRASPRPPTASASNSDRGRLIHFLALGPRTVADVMKYVGGVKGDEPFRHDLVELLKAVSTFAISYSYANVNVISSRSLNQALNLTKRGRPLRSGC
jgi:RNA polymerase II elongation factor ELL